MATFNSPFDLGDTRNGETVTVLSERQLPSLTQEGVSYRLLTIQFHKDEYICDAWPEEVIEDESPGHPGETETDNA